MTTPDLDKRLRREWTAYLLLFLGVKIYLIFSVPLLDDEAYFLTWGKHLDFGYYDHPPMIGWVSWLFSLVSDSHLFMRLFPLATISLLGYLLYKVLKPQNEIKAFAVGTSFFVGTGSLLHVPLLNDTALLFFGGLSLFYFIKDFTEPKKINIFLSCAFLSLAFLAKYLAAVLGFVYLVTLILTNRTKVLRYLGYVSLCIVPVLYFHLDWNSKNCWNNIMFNVYNRHGGQSSFEFHTYFLTLAVLLNPYVLFFASKYQSGRTQVSRFSYKIWVVTLIVFAVISLKTLVGAHWLLVFIVPAFYTLLDLPLKKLVRLVRFSAVFSLTIFAVLAGVLYKAEDIVSKNADEKKYAFYLHFFHPKEICELVSVHVPKGFTFMADGYSPASIFSSICGYDVPVIFHEGVYGRQSDKTNNFSDYDGKNIAIYSDISDNTNYEKYFASSKHLNIKLRKGQVKILLGTSFNYPRYRDEVLKRIKDKFYTRPKELSVGQCYFDEKYFKDN